MRAISVRRPPRELKNQTDQELLNYAQALFQNTKLDNTMTLAVGAPGDWLSAAKVSLEMLALLRTGSVTLNDRSIKLSGVYPNAGMEQLLSGYRRMTAQASSETAKRFPA
jgi:hypothetical protein